MKRRFLLAVLMMIGISISSCTNVNTKPIPTETFTITYHLDGGVNHESNPTTYTNKDAPITLIVASKMGYVFAGWYTDASFNNSIYYIPTGTKGNLHLYAKWTPTGSIAYTITFESNGGSDVAPIQQVSGSQIYAPDNPTKTGHIFQGWYQDDETFLVTYMFNIMPATNLTLYAKWSSSSGYNEYTISFESNLGSMVNPIAQLEHSVIYAPLQPTRAYFEFAGWFEDNDTFLILFVFETMPSQNMTLYAKWIPLSGGEIGYVCTVFGDDGVCPNLTMPYYVPLTSLYGTTLRAALHDIIDDGIPNIPNTTTGYSRTIVDWMLVVDEDQNNTSNIIEHFTRTSLPKSNYIGSPYLYPQSNVDRWDKEHVWAKSHGGQTGGATRFEQMKAWTDIHNLRPSFGVINNLRSNRDYNTRGTSTVLSVTYNQQSIIGGYNNADGSFTPIDAVKGDIARILMYMVVMYNGDAASQFLNLEFNDLINNGNVPYHGKVSVLMQWHLQDPVDALEIRRNNLIFGLQGNRNPFVDYPHFAELIWPQYYN